MPLPFTKPPQISISIRVESPTDLSSVQALLVNLREALPGDARIQPADVRVRMRSPEDASVHVDYDPDDPPPSSKI